jgi:hypothetical protein
MDGEGGLEKGENKVNLRVINETKKGDKGWRYEINY